MTEPADLSDAELCEAVAREVLGAEGKMRLAREQGGGPLGASWRNGYLPMKWSGIGQVVEAMRERGLRLIYDGLNDAALFAGIEDNQVVESAKHKDPARAVFEAALKAVRSVET